MTPLCLSERFREALSFAAEAHDGQGRKNTPVPFIAHLMTVSAIVLEFGGTEDQAIAALLHDAIEDQGGDEMRRKIRARFGDHITRLVDDMTDSEVVPKPPWRERKEAYIAHIADSHPDSVLVSMADKLHNSQSIVHELNRYGPEVFERFNAGPQETVWYYRSLLREFDKLGMNGNIGELLYELRLSVEELEQTVEALCE